MKETLIYHDISNKWIKYTAENEGEWVKITAQTGVKIQDLPAFPGAPQPEAKWFPDGTSSKVRTFPRTFLISLSRFYLRSTRDETKTIFPLAGATMKYDITIQVTVKGHMPTALPTLIEQALRTQFDGRNPDGPILPLGTILEFEATDMEISD